MNKAQNITEFEQAMQMMQIPMFNTGYADYEGNLFYIYNALLLKRLENYNDKDVMRIKVPKSKTPVYPSPINKRIENIAGFNSWQLLSNFKTAP